MRVSSIAALALALTATGGRPGPNHQHWDSGTGTTVPSPGDRPYSPNNPPSPLERPTNCGWIGLLGLTGLAGLLPRHTVTPIRTTQHGDVKGRLRARAAQLRKQPGSAGCAKAETRRDWCMSPCGAAAG